MNAQLGFKYRDRVTGFEGVAVGLTMFLFGCRRVHLQGPAKDGKLEGDSRGVEVFDEPQLELVSDTPVIVVEEVTWNDRVPAAEDKPKRTGGPHGFDERAARR